MSEMQEQTNPKELDSMAAMPAQEEMRAEIISKALGETLDNQSYFLGEVPQPHLVDPSAFLPLNSDRLLVSGIESLLSEVGKLVQCEVEQIQRLQKKINFWEDRVEKNKAVVQRNLAVVRQNTTDAVYDKKNRDYWLGRAEEVEIDYSHAEVANRFQDWAWLIKKYGLKNADGTEINAKNHCVEELCNGEISNLAAGYRATGNRYETSRKEKETENSRLIQENAKLLTNNETLVSYISATFMNEIEPLQDGVLLLKELGMKYKALTLVEGVTYGDMRAWAEPFMSDFIKANPRVSQAVVTEFRKLTSIPLPAQNC